MFASIALIENGYFEAYFAMAEGAQHTLHNTYFFDKKEVHFATWHSNFSSEKEELLSKV